MERIAHYNLLEKIGSGGMGEVYRARDTKFGRTVAVKVLPDSVAADPVRRERFLRDARAVAGISHPNIATLFEVGEEDARLFAVFEFVPGKPLSAEIDGRPINTRHAVALAVQLADAIAEAHAAGLVHGDLKPENIIVTPKGNAKILELGLAGWTRGGALRRKAPAAEAAGPAPGVVLATLNYLSPEQASGRAVDHRSDIFSLGIVIFEMLTGRHPFARPGGGAGAIASIRRDKAPLASSVQRDLPEELDPILMKALAKNPDERYSSAVSLTAELRAAAAILDVRSGDAEPPSLVRRAPAAGRAWRAMGAVVFIAALASGAWLSRGALWQMWRTYTTPPPLPIVAVQPLVAAEASMTSFADGLTEDLVARLGQIPGITVLGRSSVRANRESDPSSVAAALRAHVVLTGSVRRDGDDLHLSIGLVDPKDGARVWTRQFERPIGAVFAMQAEIAEQVARALQVPLGPSAARARTAARTVDSGAYERYVGGRDAQARLDRAGAIVLFEQAVTADPNLAEAHAELAAAIHLDAVEDGGFRDSGLVDRMRRSAVNALNLDPDLSRAHVAMSLASPRLAEAIGHLTKAIAIDPTDGETFDRLGDLIVSIDTARAVSLYRRAIDLDPHLRDAWSHVALARLAPGQADRISDTVRQATVALPEAHGVLLAGTLARLQAGRFGEALAMAQEAVGSTTRGQGTPSARLLLARAQLANDRIADARETLRALTEEVPHFCEGQAVYAGVLQDDGRVAEARAIVDRIVVEASAESALPQFARCAASAAAAIGDAVTTGAWLQRIAPDEELLRWWGMLLAGLSGDLQLRLRLYPWNKVAEAAPVLAAQAEIERAFGRLRPIVAEKLAGLP